MAATFISFTKQCRATELLASIGWIDSHEMLQAYKALHGPMLLQWKSEREGGGGGGEEVLG